MCVCICRLTRGDDARAQRPADSPARFALRVGFFTQLARAHTHGQTDTH